MAAFPHLDGVKWVMSRIQVMTTNLKA